MSTSTETPREGKITKREAYMAIRDHARMLAYILRSDLYLREDPTRTDVLDDIARVSYRAVRELDPLYVTEDLNDQLSDVILEFASINALAHLANGSECGCRRDRRPLAPLSEINTALDAQV